LIKQEFFEVCRSEAETTQFTEESGSQLEKLDVGLVRCHEAQGLCHFGEDVS